MLCRFRSGRSTTWASLRRVVLHSARYAVENGYIESFNNRLRKECLNRNHWNSLFEARVVIGDFKHEHNNRHRHSALGYRTPAEYVAACRHTHTPMACRIN
jgi:putative transposase